MAQPPATFAAPTPWRVYKERCILLLYHTQEPFNILFSSQDPDSVLISNLSAAPFWLDHTYCASVEGFLMAIMFPKNDPRHKEALTLSGRPAKRMGRWAERRHVWWYGRRLKFGSDSHEALIERAIRAKFEQNRSCMGALQRTKGKRLIHEVGHPDGRWTCLRKHTFCDILTRLRDGLLPRWPRGSHEQPLDVRVQRLMSDARGERWASWIQDAHGDAYWRFEANEKGLALGQTLEWSCRSHDRIHYLITEQPPLG